MSSLSRIPKSIVAGLGLLLVIAILTYWGGTPADPTLFYLGVAVALLACVGIAFLGWQLLYRPIDKAVTRRSVLTLLERNLIGAVLCVSMLLTCIGAVWDEVWHTRYGLPFGEDILWPPHLLIYSTLLIVLFSGAYAWWQVLRKGKGSLADRFRADPTLGTLILTALFVGFSVPLDPLWHNLYGEDITAISFPHLLLTAVYLFSALAGCGLVLSTLPRKEWSLFRITARDILPILGLMGMTVIGYLLLTADWVGLGLDGNTDRLAIISQRPAWLLPAIIVFIVGWVGTLANHSLRTAGAATIVGILALIIRYVLINVLDYVTTSVATYTPILAVMVAIDLVYTIVLIRKQQPRWYHGTIAAIASLLGVLPIINWGFVTPQITAATLPAVIVLSSLSALIGTWIGAVVGDWLATEAHQPDSVTEAGRAQLRWMVPALVLPSLLLIAVFVATAVPPV